MLFNPDMVRQRIKTICASKGWSDYKLAEVSGVPYPTVYRFTSGRHDRIELPTLMKLAQAMGVRSTQLTGEEPLNHDEIRQAMADPKAREVILALYHMDEPTKNQYIAIGQALAKPPDE